MDKYTAVKPCQVVVNHHSVTLHYGDKLVERLGCTFLQRKSLLVRLTPRQVRIVREAMLRAGPVHVERLDCKAEKARTVD